MALKPRWRSANYTKDAYGISPLATNFSVLPIYFHVESMVSVLRSCSWVGITESLLVFRSHWVFSQVKDVLCVWFNSFRMFRAIIFSNVIVRHCALEPLFTVLNQLQPETSKFCVAGTISHSTTDGRSRVRLQPRRK